MKLLVTTDFSTNSKGAIRFAQVLSKQSKNVDVTFYYTVHVFKPTIWSKLYFEKYKHEEIERLTTELKKFVNSTLNKNISEFNSIKYVIDDCISAEDGIIKYAEKNKMDNICMATRGAGLLKKILGTHSSHIVNHSKVPVIVVPSNYKSKTLENITYLADFENFKNELLKVVKFSNENSLKLEVLHYSSIITDPKKFKKNTDLLSDKLYENVKLNIEKNNYELSFVDRISKYVKNSKPEILVMFTKRERSFFENIFLASKSAELTYNTKIPLLIFPK
jgi:nucleotide-binding universal stress UspA family protein